MTSDEDIRADGRTMRDTYLMRAKKPQDSHGEWELLDVVEHIKGEDAFRAQGEGGCPPGELFGAQAGRP